MPTALIDACRIGLTGSRIYTLGRRAAKVGIRDAMWRAQILCEKLFSDQLRRSKSGPKVLIIGGGPSALVCALTARRFGISSVIVERTKRLAKRQADCGYRGICPTTFDFPFLHWPEGKYPVFNARAVLPWTRAAADDVHREWMRYFDEQIAQDPDKTRIILEASVSSWPEDVSTHAVLPITVHGYEGGTPPGTTTTVREDFDLVIFCPGVGDEIRTVPAVDGSERTAGQFSSFGFWDDYDPLFEFEDRAAARKLAKTRVLIGGGRDGALGDFITLLTGQKFLADVLNRIPFSRKELAEIQQLRMQLDAYQQLGEPADDGLLRRLQGGVCKIERQAWARREIKDALWGLLRPEQERPWLQIAMSTYHFTFSNIANRITAQLFARLLADIGVNYHNGGMIPFRVGVRLVSVESAAVDDHQCNSDHELCADYPHRVLFEPEAVSATAGGEPFNPFRSEMGLVYQMDASPVICNRVLLRFGVSQRFDAGSLSYENIPLDIRKAAVGEPAFSLVNPFEPA